MKKKSLFLAAAATLLLTSQVAMAASPHKTTISHPLDFVDPSTNQTAPLYTGTEGIISPEAALGVPLYAQSGQTWSSKIMQTCGTTISSEGCALTATSMVFKYYGVAIDPGTMNTKMGTYACPFYWSEAITRAGAGIVKTVSTSSPTAWTSVYPAAKAAIDAGKPYIVGMNYSGGTHFVVLSGYTNSGSYAANYTINDPAGGVQRSLSYYSANGYTPYRGVVYSK